MHISKLSIKMIRVRQYIFKILLHEPLILIESMLIDFILSAIKILVDILIDIRMFLKVCYSLIFKYFPGAPLTSEAYVPKPHCKYL